ncbi:hypothetical protein BKA93DRAFT_218570 [Sparassis latifolia]
MVGERGGLPSALTSTYLQDYDQHALESDDKELGSSGARVPRPHGGISVSDAVLIATSSNFQPARACSFVYPLARERRSRYSGWASAFLHHRNLKPEGIYGRAGRGDSIIQSPGPSRSLLATSSCPAHRPGDLPIPDRAVAEDDLGEVSCDTVLTYMDSYSMRG